MSAADVIDALVQPNRSQRLAWPITVEQWTRLNEEIDRAYEHLSTLYATFPLIVPAAGGFGNVPPTFASQPAAGGGGITDFWGDWTVPPTGPFFGWDAVGDPDPGVCLRTQGDGFSVNGYNDGVSGVNFSVAGFFESGGLVAPTDTITTVQWRISLDAVAMDPANMFGIVDMTGGAGTNIPFTGIGASPFTGSALYESAVYTLNPFTAGPWAYEDVIAPQNTPFSPGTDFRGWWGLNAVGSVVDLANQRFNVDYLDVVINGLTAGSGGGTVSTTVLSYLAAQRKPFRRGRLAWPPSPSEWSELNEQMDDVYRQLTRVYELLPIVAGVEAPPA